MKSFLLLFIAVCLAVPAFAGVTVNTPTPGTVTSPFELSASSATCGGVSTVSMGWSLDNSSDTAIVHAQTMDVQVSASTGKHTLHVKSWAPGESECLTDVDIDVEAAPPPGPVIPSDAVSVSSIQVLKWKGVHDTGTSGSSSGTSSMVTSPSKDGTSRKFSMTYKSGGGERWDISFGDDTSAQNFVYDGWVYLNSTSKDIANLELDLNDVMANGQNAIFGFQCAGGAGVWEYSANLGTATKPKGAWEKSKAACNPDKWTMNAWHHVQIAYSRTEEGVATYQTVWLDGKSQPINATVLIARADGWAPVLNTNFQIDGKGASGSVTAYLDDLTVYRW